MSYNFKVISDIDPRLGEFDKFGKYYLRDFDHCLQAILHYSYDGLELSV
jgi:hypothetical protein